MTDTVFGRRGPAFIAELRRQARLCRWAAAHPTNAGDKAAGLTVRADTYDAVADLAERQIEAETDQLLAFFGCPAAQAELPPPIGVQYPLEVGRPEGVSA